MRGKAILVCLGITLAFLLLAKLPVRGLFRLVSLEAYALEAKIYLFGGLTLFACHRLAARWEISGLVGFSGHKPKAYWVLLLPFLFPGLFAWMSMDLNCALERNAFLQMSATLLVLGMLEEWVFRGLVLGYLLKNGRFRSVHHPIILSSAIFGLGHFFNLGRSELVGVSNQVIYAFYMGLLFSALVLATRNIWLTGLVHGLLNIINSVCGETIMVDTLPVYQESLGEMLLRIMLISLVFSPVLLIYFIINSIYPLQQRAVRSE